MRGADEQSGSMFSYVSLEDRVPADHPLRAIRHITDRALERLSPQFGRLYIHFGRPSVPPEKLLRALLLQALYTIRSERQLMEQLDYNLLFRWFVGLGIDDAVWSPTTFRRIAIGCSRATSPRPSLRRSCCTRRRSGCCRTITSRSMARCSRRGRVTRVFSPAIRIRRRPGAAIRRGISMGSDAQ